MLIEFFVPTGSDRGGTVDTNCRRALFLTNPIDDRAEVETDKPPLVTKACEWVLKHTTFESWLGSDNESRLLWISGASGMGKTMMSIFLLKELENGHVSRDLQRGLILFYFVDKRNDKRNNAVSILRGLIHLLLDARPSLMSHILPDFQIQSDSLFAQTSLEALWRIFTSMLKDPGTGTVWCLIDGLDECREDCLIRFLKKMTRFFEEDKHYRRMATLGSQQNQANANIKMILVSRETPACIPENLCSHLHISISTPTAGLQEPKPAVSQDERTGESSSKIPTDVRSGQPKLANIVRLAMQKRKANVGVNSTIAYEGQEQSQVGLIKSSFEESQSPPELSGNQAHDLIDQRQAGGHTYVFDPPPEYDNERTSYTPGLEAPEDTDMHEQAAEHQGSESESHETNDPGHNALDHYITARVAQLSVEMGFDDTDSADITASLRITGDGTFLWVDLALDEIKRCPVCRIKEVLEQLVPGIDNMYCRWLLRIAPGMVSLTSAILRWVVVARRPMQLKELSAALTFMGFSSSDPDGLVNHGIAACGSLLAMREDGTVNTTHESVRAFLTTAAGPLWSDYRLHKFYVAVDQVDSEIAALCIRYLECFLGQTPLSKRSEDYERREAWAHIPLLAYAVEFWPSHLQSTSQPRFSLASPFFKHKSPIRKNWWPLYYMWKTGKPSFAVPINFNLLHLAAYVNAPSIAQEMERDGSLYSRLDSLDSHFLTPLCLATEAGNWEMFHFLLRRGANTKAKYSESTFHTACKSGQSSMVEYLLGMGHGVNDISEPSGINKKIQKLKGLGRW